VRDLSRVRRLAAEQALPVCQPLVEIPPHPGGVERGRGRRLGKRRELRGQVLATRLALA
jgi:hypothetical protein